MRSRARGLEKCSARITVFAFLTLVLMIAPIQTKAQNSLDQLSRSFESLTRKVSPSVVQILVTGYGSINERASTVRDILPRTRSGGSGVILDPDGYIVTNAHVIEGAHKIQVVLSKTQKQEAEWRSILKPEGELVGAQIVGIDRETDLAVLRIYRSDLPYLRLGDSDSLKQGELVLAFGSPLGLDNSVTIGVVSSVARQLGEDEPMIYIQTDASINPGNSGGPLVNSRGEVVGINTLIFSQSGGSEGIGFAAPSNIVKNVFEQIRSTGRVRRAQIGVNAQTISPALAKALKLPQEWGVIISDIYPDGPAFNSGLNVGDIILTLNRKRMENARQFYVNLYRSVIGEQVSMRVVRGSDTLVIQVPVAERPDDPGQFSDMVNPDQNLIPQLGILALELDNRVKRILPGLRFDYGVVVAARSSNASFVGGGLLPGDVIYSINNKPLRNLEELRGLLNKMPAGTIVAIYVERFGRLVYIPYELE